MKTRAHILSALAIMCLAVTANGAAHANVSDRVAFQVPQKIVSKTLPSLPGVTRILLATNTPYVIRSEGVIGELHIDFESEGRAQGQNFGSKSQAPVSGKSCVYLDQPYETPLFVSKSRTANQSGRPIEQAIVVVVTHDPAVKPNLTVEAARPGETTLHLPCN